MLRSSNNFYYYLGVDAFAVLGILICEIFLCGCVQGRKMYDERAECYVFLQHRRLIVSKDSVSANISMYFSRDGEKLYSTESSSSTVEWNLADGKRIREVSIGGEGLLPLSNDERVAIVSSGGGFEYETAVLLDWKLGETLLSKRIEQGYNATVTEDGTSIIVAGDMYNTKDGSLIRNGVKIDVWPTTFVRIDKGLAFSRYAVIRSVETPDDIRIWDTVNSRGVSLADAPASGTQLDNLAVMNTNAGIIVVVEDRAPATWCAHVWDGASGKKLSILSDDSLARTIVRDMAISPSGEIIATVQQADLTTENNAERDVCIWSSKTGQLVGKLNGHKECVTRLLFSPDGKYLASAGMDGIVILWKLPMSDRESRK